MDKKIVTMLVAVLAVLIVLSGCKSLTEEDARTKTNEFLKQNLKFYATVNNSRVLVDQYYYRINQLEKDGGNWNIEVYVWAEVNGTIKNRTLDLRLDKKGDIAALNEKI